MPWAEFTKTFFWKTIRVHGILYKKGTKALVTTPCLEKAIAVNAAIKIDRPPDAKRISYGNNKKFRQVK